MPTRLFDLSPGDKFTFKGETFTLLMFNEHDNALVKDKLGNHTTFNPHARIEPLTANIPNLAKQKT